MIEREDVSFQYSTLGEWQMIVEFVVNHNGEREPEYIPEEAEVGASVQLVPITETQIVTGVSDTEPRKFNPENIRKMCQAYKEALPAGHVGVRAVWSEPNETEVGVIAKRKKESVTVSADIHGRLEVIKGSKEPSFVLYPYTPAAYPDQTWYGLKNISEVPKINGGMPGFVEASAKYHDQKTFLSFDEKEESELPNVLAESPGVRIIPISEFQQLLLSKTETQVVDAQAISAVARYLYSKEENPQEDRVLVHQEYPYHAVSVPTLETNPWFRIERANDQPFVLPEAIPEDDFATQKRYLPQTQEIINPATNEAITIQVKENHNAQTINERYSITVQSELSSNHYLQRVLLAIGGGVEDGERPTEAMQREELEESGKKGQLTHLGGKIYRSPILQSSVDTFISWNPEISAEEAHPDELEAPIPHTYSIAEIKSLISNGKITDVATISALHRTIVFLESLPLATPELKQHLEKKHEAAVKKMEYIVLGLLERPEYKLLLEKIDNISRLAHVSKEGLIRRGDNKLPDFTEEGALFTKLMQDGSVHILRNSQNLTEYQTMLSEFLGMIEGNVANHLLGLDPESQHKLRKVFTQIASETIDLFAGIDFNDLLAGNYDQLQQKKNSARNNASKSGSRQAPKIIKIFEPGLIEEQVRSRVVELRNFTTVQDLYRIAAEVLGYSGRTFPKNGMDTLINLLTQKTTVSPGDDTLKYVQYLRDEDHEKLADILKRSEKAKYQSAVTQTDRERLAVLQGIHVSWAASQGLLNEKRLDRDAYTPLPALILQKFQERISELESNHTEITPNMIDQSILVAVIELMKDLIYLEV